jgi:NAD(P)-dependent dehydrogenase (short-subunit alcohol dehydrogenase family)
MTKFLVIAASSYIGQVLVSLLKESGHSVFTTARDDSKIRPRDQYQSVIDASLTTAFATVHAAGKYMNKGGSVMLISSAAAMQGLANHEAIAAAKAGIIGLTLSAAATYASMNLRVNAVAPGLIETSLTKNLTGNETSRKFSEALHALGRLGKPEDIARAIVFLLDPDNSWITGQVLAVDGGLSSVLPKMRV